jgi:sugar O-acyltransferase (sialic acid O-acetyltransferase NeuD family)
VGRLPVVPARVVIFGARRDGSAKVLLDIIDCAGECEVVAFLDDNAEMWGQTLDGLPIVGGRAAFGRLREEGVAGIAFAVGDNRARERLLEEARAAGLKPVTAVHPEAVVARGVTLGEGVWIAAGSILIPGKSVGEGVVINTGATVDHDCRIASYANISPGTHLSGRTIIERYASLGTGSITLPDARIGEGATVGAGAVVLKDVAAGTTVIGVPARRLER